MLFDQLLFSHTCDINMGFIVLLNYLVILFTSISIKAWILVIADVNKINMFLISICALMYFVMLKMNKIIHQ